MFVFVKDATQALVFSYVQVSDLARFGDRRGQWMQRAGIGDALVGSVLVVEVFVLAQSVEQVVLVPDQGPVEQFSAAGLHPPFHDRIHSRDLDAAEHNLDPGIGEDCVEQSRKLAIPVPDQKSCPTSCVLQVHDQPAPPRTRKGAR